MYTERTAWTSYEDSGRRGHPRHFEREWAVGPGGQVWRSHPTPNNADGWDSRWWLLSDELAAEVRELLTA